MRERRPLNWRTKPAALAGMLLVPAVMMLTRTRELPLPESGKGVRLLIAWFFTVLVWLQILAIADIVAHRRGQQGKRRDEGTCLVPRQSPR